MNFIWFSNWLVKHPYVILSAISVFSGTCIILPFTMKSMRFPSFQDPQMGFSTRGTFISNRLTTWANLEKATRPSGLLVKNPKEYLMTKNMTNSTNNELPYIKKNKGVKKVKPAVVYGNVSLSESKRERDTTERSGDTWKVLQNLTAWSPVYKKPPLDNYLCGSPEENYAHFVVTSKDHGDIFTLENLHSLCKLENVLMNLNHYNSLCIHNNDNQGEKCCKPWSLPNYIAILHEKTSCLSITEDDVVKTKNLLEICAQYFHSMDLNTNCFRKSGCSAPVECMRQDAVFIILNYLTSSSFLPSNDSRSETSNLTETMIFLPLAASTAILPFYHEVENLNLDFEGLSIVAMDFGIKSALFDEYLLRDAWFIGFGAVFIFFCIWIYTTSLFLTTMTITVIVFSMAIAYFLYFLVYDIRFFPFMNVLTAVVCIGIGSDDAFIFCKVWQMQKNDQRNQHIISKIMFETFQHAFVSMFVTALTTAVAFWGSYVSAVTAISCFSIFAGTAVMVNYILMMTWFPACLVIWEQSCLSKSDLCRSYLLTCSQIWCCFKSKWNLSSGWCKCSGTLWNAKKQFIINLVIRLRYFWLVFFTALAIAASIVVFVYPKLKLPNTTEFQLFLPTHPFEQYDFVYKSKFWFRTEDREAIQDYRLPMRFVWGVLPIDNGDHLNPTDMGTLVLDPNFDIADPIAQEWLRNFCTSLRQQPFYQPVVGPLLSNCFIETFARSMKRKCIDSISAKNINPCCEGSEFPFNRTVFNKCIVEDMAETYLTPTNFLHPQTAGPKFSKDQTPTIKAIVVEYDSTYSFSMSYEQINEFFTKVNDWTTEQLASAPFSMKNGFFISELDFYDLQHELGKGTRIAIAISMALALSVLFLSTLNPLTSILAVVTITFTIIVVMAVLVLLKWRLNILESAAISTAIGLSVDFSLHYSINYRLCPPELAVNREDATRYALSCMMGPALMAALTTATAGVVMMFSLVLPYFQMGIFLVLVMSISWVYATFLLGALLAVMGPNKKQCQYSYSRLLCCIFGNTDKAEGRINNTTSSSISGNHELDHLTYVKHDRDKHTPRSLRRSLSGGGVRYTPGKQHAFTDQSPSATSAITIIMADDN